MMAVVIVVLDSAAVAMVRGTMVAFSHVHAPRTDLELQATARTSMSNGFVLLVLVAVRSTVMPSLSLPCSEHPASERQRNNACE